MYNCKDCDYNSTSKQTLRQHEKAEHEGIRYNCETCEFVTRSRNYLKKHILSHTNVFVCNKCHYATNYEHNLKTHMTNKHTNPRRKNRDCDKCLYTARTESDMQKHPCEKLQKLLLEKRQQAGFKGVPKSSNCYCVDLFCKCVHSLK